MLIGGALIGLGYQVEVMKIFDTFMLKEDRQKIVVQDMDSEFRLNMCFSWEYAVCSTLITKSVDHFLPVIVKYLERTCIVQPCKRMVKPPLYSTEL